jgi:prenyltransferase beta subunit
MFAPRPTPAAKCHYDPPDHLSTLLIPLHVKHILRLSSNTTSLAYHLSTHLRINGVYWGLMALGLMGRGEELKADELVEFVMSCWDKESGETPHASTSPIEEDRIADLSSPSTQVALGPFPSMMLTCSVHARQFRSS